METDNFDKKLVEKIKQDKITPKPRWHFLLKDYVIWASGTISLLIGAAAVSVMIYLFKYSSWDIREATHKSVWEFFLLTLPYFWIIFLGLFVFILYYNLKHTKRGYLYPIWLIATVSVIASILLGSIFFWADVGEQIDNLLGERAPLYDTVINRDMMFWFSPGEGRLTGLVVEKSDDSRFEIIDPQGNDWEVLMPEVGPTTEILIIGEPVHLVGKTLSDSSFQAYMVRPVRLGRGFLARPHDDKPRPPFPLPLLNQ
jgi:glucan phosphoethanolaminetransferase (alkaline phosphatase superfamily)